MAVFDIPANALSDLADVTLRAVFETVPEALDAIRRLVREGGKAIRIAGLSGIGKTRLAQSLFEQTGVGEPLPASWAVYTDVGRDPDPLPLPMLETLIASNAPAILIIDNCPRKTHRVLAERLAKSNAKVRLITIEYDVRDDRPEETEVVRIEAEGPEIVEALIRRRFPDRSAEDARRLAELALGNARLALALAAAAPETGSLSSFDDEMLFRRLFWQREQADPQFEQSAEALSLVYSFDVEGVENPNELGFIFELTGIPRLTLHRHATTLVERGLAQVRGRWRAVLPHALANRLAARALRGLPWRDIATSFAHPDATRLRRSLARRLIDEIGPELFAARHNNPADIGYGLGSVADDPRTQWRQLRNIYLAAPEQTRRPAILAGFLTALDDRMPALANEIRDECLVTPALRLTYAAFAPVGRISERELERLRTAAGDPDVWAWQFGGFVWSDRHGLNDDERVQLLSAMMAGTNGSDAVIDALGMLIHCEQQAPRDWPSELRGIGINTVTTVLIGGNNRIDGNVDHRAADVVRKCLLFVDEVGARRLVDAVVAHAERRYGSLYDVERIVAAVAERAPTIFLDRALGEEAPRLRLGRDATIDQSPLAGIEPGALVDWCRAGRAERWIAVAKAIQPYGPSDDDNNQRGGRGLTAQAMAILADAPHPEAVVAAFIHSVEPMSWSGSRATIMQRRLAALEQLSSHPDERVRQAFEGRVADLRRRVDNQRERERTEDRERDVSFE